MASAIVERSSTSDSCVPSRQPQVIDNLFRSLLPHRQAKGREVAADFLFDCVKCADPTQRLLSGPARTDRRPPAAPARSMLVARGVDPQPSRLGAPSAWRLSTGTVGSSAKRWFDANTFPARRSCSTFSHQQAPPTPSGQRRTWQIESMAGEDLRLPIECRVIAALADRRLGKQRRRRKIADDRPLGSQRLRELFSQVRQAYLGRVVRMGRAAAPEPNPASRSPSLR